jgi:2,2-dialkylglycine decarboxylase (pyruvate)
MLTQSNQENDRLLESASRHLIRYGHFFQPGVIASAKGAYMTTVSGKRLLDFASGQMSSILGHSHPEVVSVIQKQSEELIHLYSQLLSRPVIELGELLASIAPGDLGRSLFLSTGGESNEAALRMAKTVTGGYEVLGLSRSWHGVTHGVASVTYNSSRKGHGPAAPGSFVLPAPTPYRPSFMRDGQYDWLAELDFGFELYDRQTTGAPAALIIESIMSSGGVIVPPKGYLKAAVERARARGMLVVIDEAQTGLGRTGKLFDFEHEGIVPDFVTLSKTLGAGLPLSAVITTPDIEQKAFEKGFHFYTTHASDPLPAAVGKKVVEIILRDKLADRALQAGERLMKGLKELMQRYEVIGDVRGRGLMIGMEIVKDRERKTPAPEIAQKLMNACFDAGLSTSIIRGAWGVFRIAPPITITDEEIDLGLSMFDTAFRQVIR